MNGEREITEKYLENDDNQRELPLICVCTCPINPPNAEVFRSKVTTELK